MNLIFPKKCNFVQKRLVRVFYSFLVQCTWFLLGVVAKFNQKIKYFVEGRKKTFLTLQENLPTSKEIIWMHAASLGEYEQGLPVLEALKKVRPNYYYLLTFFSPSGYEVKKDSTPADLVMYLPMDTQKKARRFLDGIQPKIALFIKYEIWPNYLSELQNRHVPTFLVSGIFSKRQVYFKWYGGFMRKALKAFDHFFVQEDNSKKLLDAVGCQNVTISGDTRFDRVHEILHQENFLDFMERFKGNSKCFVAGSTWPEDEKIMLGFINSAQTDIKIVIAPHNIKVNHISSLQAAITKKSVLYSDVASEKVSEAEVLIIDTIGLLTKIYSYADMAYVGGGFSTGLHNTLEPAVFGTPVLIGPHYEGFYEAKELVSQKGIISISNQREFEGTIRQLIEDDKFSAQTGSHNTAYLLQKKGATQKVMEYLKPLI